MSFTLLSESEPVARKDYRCLWCNESIVKGEKHFHYTGKMEGRMQSSRMHLECRDAMHDLHRLDRYAVEDGFEPGSFNRGCCCERGWCKCPAAPRDEPTGRECQVISDFAGPPIVVCGPTTTVVRRTWRERWLSRPWRPLRKFKVISIPHIAVAPDQMLRIGDKLYVGEIAYEQIKKVARPAAAPAPPADGEPLPPAPQPQAGAAATKGCNETL